MGLERIRRVSSVIPASPQRIYDAWLSSEEHSAFTGAEATITKRVGGKFTAHDGYISGKTLELEKGERIVQSWRTTDFPEDAEDSEIEIKLKPVGTGTRIILTHKAIPEGQMEKYHHGWGEKYFNPMFRYFMDKSLAEAAPPTEAAPRRKATTRPRATNDAAAERSNASDSRSDPRGENSGRRRSGSSRRRATTEQQASPSASKRSASKASQPKASPAKKAKATSSKKAPAKGRRKATADEAPASKKPRKKAGPRRKPVKSG